MRKDSIINNYKGTLVVVSHDRDFLDQTIGKILAFNGDGEIDEYVGNYSDYLAHLENEKIITTNDKAKNVEKTQVKNKANKMSYKYKFELEQLPTKIKQVETEITNEIDPEEESNG